MAPRTFPFTEAHVLVPDTLLDALLGNGRAAYNGGHDPRPVVKWFTPDAGCTWIITELDPEDPDRAFGLCDLGMGSPELGWVYLPELKAGRGPLGLPIERDLHFRTEHPISVWADAARGAQRIIDPRCA
jgi:hypothetical protein